MLDKEIEIYKENCAHFRALNSILWQVPVIAMTLNGGLWFAISKMPLNLWAISWILAFAAICNISLVYIVCRLRKIMDIILLKTLDFEEEEPRKGFKVVIAFSILFIAAASINAIICISIWCGTDIFKTANTLN